MGTDRVSRVGRLLAVAGVFVVVAVFAGQARAAFPGQNGQISFTNDSGGSFQFQIARMNPDGSHSVELTPTSMKHDSFRSDWSPNGREIVFDSDRTGAWQVYTMHADGSDKDQLTHLRGFTGQPSWSPDGSRIVFANSPTGNPPFSLYTIGAEGGSVHRLTHSAQDEESPQYSPDGRWIVFSTLPRTGAPALYLVRADGSHLHRLTPPRLRAFGSDWSPDGRRIVSFTNADVPHSVVFTIRPDGTDIRLITSGPTAQNEAYPSYSPDGRQIVFARGLPGQDNSDLWVMNADGSNQHNITNTPNVIEVTPDWGTHRLTH
jgi:TolB protein